MLAVPGQLPEGAGWAFEFKWDGVRAVVYAEGPEARAMSRNDRDVTVSYPEIHEVSGALSGLPAVLDGELVAFDPSGRPDFGTLQRRMHVGDAAVASGLAAAVPVTFVAFDLLRLDGHQLLREPYDHRRELLESLELVAEHLLIAPAFAESGSDVLAASRERGMEGVVAKRRESTYEPGRRSPSWRKIKLIRTQEVVVGGWRPGNGRRADQIGSLMMGLPSPAGLRYIGQVGTGFSDDALADLGRRLTRLEVTSSPFTDRLPSALARTAHWCRPEIVGEVAFTEWTGDGVLRHPAWRGLRPDKSPADVRRE
ncbi:MAG: non-homologous end-joining DNA ligase [Actinobacteria bacterium]|nr:non-homologous end-joining DNA ligase [Actinomycetota bacterium]